MAYSSISHINFIVRGLWTWLIKAPQASLLMMLSHGFVSAALFLFVGLSFYKAASRLLFFTKRRSSIKTRASCLLLFRNFGLPLFLGSFREILFFCFLFKRGRWFFLALFLYCVFMCYRSLFCFSSFAHGKAFVRAEEKGTREALGLRGLSSALLRVHLFLLNLL